MFTDQTPQARMMPAKGTDKNDKLFKLMESYKANDKESIQKDIAQHLEYSLACTRFSFTQQDAFRATAFAVRDRLLESLNDTNTWYAEQDVKKGYYLSAEYLMGRAFQNSLVNLDIEEPFKDALMGLGLEMEELYPNENDPGLGNGG